MSALAEAAAIRAIVRWPYLARAISADDFCIPGMRDVYAHLADGGRIFRLDVGTRAYATMLEHDLWDTDEASVEAVAELRESTKWYRRSCALEQALLACDTNDAEAYQRAMNALQKL